MGLGGPERWTYRILQEPTLSTELHSLANPVSLGNVEAIDFQPSQLHEFRSQDRMCIENWQMPSGGTWTFTAIFDGHVGHATVEHAAQTLPSMVKHALESLLRSSKGHVCPAAVSGVLSDCIVRFDHSITADFIRLFPGGLAGLQGMTSSQIRYLFQDRSSASQNLAAATRCLQGSTVLLTLMDPAKHNLWIANLGDCQAVLGSRTHTGDWSPTFVTALHDGDNPSEVLRIRSQHPGERECMKDNRVVGFLGPTRSLGDTWLKLPSIFSQRVLLNFPREWNVQRPETYIARVKSPPYVSNVPDVHHIPLSRGLPGQYRDRFLISCSDGLADLYSGRTRTDMIQRWLLVVGQSIEKRKRAGNLALSLLRDGLGGDNIYLVSQKLTVEMEEKWMDDVTIIVQRF
ncbi:protein serine/threonine phosphatase 2C [Multifurca ochricompacta]|uniref:Protein serine/threonine phosphatase 2C n=1 Tax=Multifurca ochricompacta TaxID=376703 RepID=A0AAD4MAA5_9AGAM|nr:protein serine/threonine phosphatase 2C [Multifurca ochricompacta]